MTLIPELRAELDRVARAQAGAAQRAVDRLDTAAGPLGARAATRSQRLRRSLRRGGFPLLVAAIVGVSGVATATSFVVSSHTKQQSARLAAGPRATLPGRVSKLGAQMVKTAREIQATLPYPPGMRDGYDWSKFSMGATLGTGGESRREIEGMSEFRAACLWRRYYLRSYDAHDEQGMHDAAAILIQSHQWPATSHLDPHTVVWGAFDTDAAAGRVVHGGRNAVEINCYDHTKAELTGKVPLKRHSGEW